ncbi:MAG: hypothetical protein AB7I25_06100 [Vicinamibacterales bacterium]
MNVKRLAMGVIAAWVVSIILGYVVNEILLKGLFEANAAAFRPEAELMANLPVGFGFMLLGFCVFGYMYVKGYEGGSGVGEGARFGAMVGVLLSVLSVNWIWATMPISVTLAAAMMIDYVVEYAIYGAIIGGLYRKA